MSWSRDDHDIRHTTSATDYYQYPPWAMDPTAATASHTSNRPRTRDNEDCASWVNSSAFMPTCQKV